MPGTATLPVADLSGALSVGVRRLRDFYARLNDNRDGLAQWYKKFRNSLMARKLYTNQVNMGG